MNTIFNTSQYQPIQSFHNSTTPTNNPLRAPIRQFKPFSTHLSHHQQNRASLSKNSVTTAENSPKHLQNEQIGSQNGYRTSHKDQRPPFFSNDSTQVASKRKESKDYSQVQDLPHLRLFVGGITGKTKISTLETLFSQFGTVTKVKLIKNSKGGCKGFCFVTFSQESEVATVINAGNLWLNDRLLSIRRVIQGEDLNKKMTKKNLNRFILYSLPLKLSDEQSKQLREYFSSLGKLEYYYFTSMRCERIDSREILDYAARHNTQRVQKTTKVNLLNISYVNETITQQLLARKWLNIGSLQPVVHEYFKFKSNSSSNASEKTKDPSPVMLKRAVNQFNSHLHQ